MKWIGTQVIYNDLRLKRKLFLEAPEAGGSGIDKFLCLNDVGNVRYRTGTQLLSDIGGGATNSVSLLADDVNSYASGGNADGTVNATAAIIQVKGGEGINTTANDQIGFSGGAFPAITITGEDASTTNKGIVELATTAETTTGTATGLAVTPDGLKDGYQGSANVTTLGTIGTGVWQGTTIKTAYIGDDQVTEDKLADTLLAEIDANTAKTGISEGQAEAITINTAKATNVATNLTATTHASQITINSSDGTNVVVAEASGSIAGVMTVAHHDKLDGIEASATADQTRADIEGLGITVVGTIGEGTWRGTAIASAYLDADTAHYSATRQVTHHMITDDIDSDVIYISLGEIDSEGTSNTGKHLPLIAPTAGKLLKIFLRTSVNYSSETFTWKLYTRNVSASTGGGPSEIGAQSGAGPTNKTMVTYDFTSSLDSGTNAIAAGDKVQISIEAGDGATANGNYFITCLWEWDLS